MIISHKHKFIFFKTAKTAGTSLEIALSRFCGENDIITPIVEEDEAIRRSLGYPSPQNYEVSAATADTTIFKKGKSITFYNHISAREIKSCLRDEVWHQYFKFCFERNPLERVVSLYHHYIGYLSSEDKYLSLSDFINSDLIMGLQKWGFDIYTINNEIVVNQVCLYEKLEEEIEKICLQLNLPEKLVLPKAKAQYRKDKRADQVRLIQKDKEIIAKFFEKEIQLFKYKI